MSVANSFVAKVVLVVINVFIIIKSRTFVRWKIESDDVVISTVENENTNAEEVEYVQCSQCGIVFEDMKYFIDHMNVEHEAQMHYCQYCKLVYHGKEKEFEEHLSIHNDELKDATENEVLKCVNKTRKGDKPSTVGVEKSSTVGVKKPSTVDVANPLYYTCNFCERIFTRKPELKKHMHTHSNRIQNSDESELVDKAKQIIDDRVSYKCDMCKKFIFTKRGFLRHIRVHSDKRPCKCDLCGKSYRIEQDLARHIRDVHERLKKYNCDICGRAFANKGSKDDHRRIHTGERPYACEYCPKMFRTLNSIYIHNRVHTDYKPHKCSYCGKYFRSKQRLTHHETTHTGIKAFACEICGKTFSVKGEVGRHRAVHNEEKPFNCKCGVKFGQKRYLRNHIRQQHQEMSSRLLADLLGNKN
ncbi:PREDICTED: zinc finger protein 664-like [Habropoda laboriosa]|uniref:zinc finger protein 664-like n=1 Tax=Habropoda laboriosa TaxID=597456 RepID=UPI00083D36EB|nr:PREDICTED: zinc finger protein 664-like [Habropoda laboriosa]